jgi:glycosyltransferase involved in cell wall biosynthesis
LHISAVIPTYNRGRLIGRAIESVLQQSKQPTEIVVVDDGSTDDTGQKVASFGTQVCYIYQDNAGAAAARNRGVREARSEWIAFLDSDDVWLEQHLERMAHAIEATSGAADFYFTDAFLTAHEGGGQLWDACDFAISGDYELALDATDWVMMRWPPMLLQASVFKRASYLESGGLWERLSTREDTHFFLKMGLGGSACAVAGCNVQMTADAPENRLTLAHGKIRPSGHWMRVLLYQDILNRMPELEPVHRRELRERLAGAHRQLARLAWQHHRPWAAAWHVGRSMIVEPGFLFLHFPRSLLVGRGSLATGQG